MSLSQIFFAKAGERLSFSFVGAIFTSYQSHKYLPHPTAEI
jgi:hypothetical protein